MLRRHSEASPRGRVEDLPIDGDRLSKNLKTDAVFKRASESSWQWKASTLFGFGDCVRCFSCGGGLRHWEDGDIPWIEHARWYPCCEYLKQRKGDLFIEMHRHRENRDEEDPWQPPPPPQSPPSSGASQGRQSQQSTPRDEVKNAPQKAKEDEEKDDIAVTSVLEMGYNKSTISSAVEQLRKQGKSKYTAVDIMEIILEQEEKQTTTTSTTSTTTNTNTTHTPSTAIASKQSKASIASADSQSLMKENNTLKDQMLCKICLDKDASMVYLPCGHVVTCPVCAPTIRKCCICRKLIQGSVRAYL